MSNRDDQVSFTSVPCEGSGFDVNSIDFPQRKWHSKTRKFTTSWGKNNGYQVKPSSGTPSPEGGY